MKKEIKRKLKNNAIRSVMEVDPTVCKEKCNWYGSMHAKSFHWVADPEKYFPNGMKK